LNKTEIINKYKDFIFEIQTQSEGFFLYTLNDIDFIPHDEEYNQDQLYLIFESLSSVYKEIVFEINLGVDVLAVFEKMIGHFKKTIRVESTESEFEFSQDSCVALKEILFEVIKGNEPFLNDASKDCIKNLEPYFFNNIRFI
jgi:hypothetical protein